MSLYLPEELRWLGWVAGAAWPDGDEDLAWEVSAAWKAAKDELLPLLAKLDEAKSATMAAYPQGAAAEEMGARYDVLRTGDHSIEMLIEAVGAVSDSAFDMGTELQATKITIIVTLCWLAAEIAWAWLFPPTAPINEAAAILTTRSVLKVMQDSVQKTIANIAARMGAPTANKLSFWKALSQGKFVAPSAKGWGVYGARAGEAVAIAGGINASVQVGQIADGKRREFNGKEFGFSVLGGVAGALPAREMGRLLGHFADKGGNKLISKTGWNLDNAWYRGFRGAGIGAIADGFGAIAGNLAVGVANVASGGKFEDSFLSGEGWAGGFIQGGLVGGARGASAYTGYIPKIGDGVSPGQFRRNNFRANLWWFPKSVGQGFFAATPKPGTGGHTDGSTRPEDGAGLSGTTGGRPVGPNIPMADLATLGGDVHGGGSGNTTAGGGRAPAPAPPPLMSGALLGPPPGNQGSGTTANPLGGGSGQQGSDRGGSGTGGPHGSGGNSGGGNTFGGDASGGGGNSSGFREGSSPAGGNFGQGGGFGEGSSGPGGTSGGGGSFGQGGDSGQGGGFGQGANFGQGGGFGEGSSGPGGTSGGGGSFGQGGDSSQGGNLGQGGDFGQGGNFGQGGDSSQGGGFGQGGSFGQGGDSGQGGGFGQGGDSGQGGGFGQGGSFGQGGDSGQGGGFGQGGNFGQGGGFGEGSSGLGGNAGGGGNFGQGGDSPQGGSFGQGGNSGSDGQYGPAGVGDRDARSDGSWNGSELGGDGGYSPAGNDRTGTGFGGDGNGFGYDRSYGTGGQAGGPGAGFGGYAPGGDGSGGAGGGMPQGQGRYDDVFSVGSQDSRPASPSPLTPDAPGFPHAGDPLPVSPLSDSDTGSIFGDRDPVSPLADPGTSAFGEGTGGSRGDVPGFRTDGSSNSFGDGGFPQSGGRPGEQGGFGGNPWGGAVPLGSLPAPGYTTAPGPDSSPPPNSPTSTTGGESAGNRERRLGLPKLITSVPPAGAVRGDGAAPPAAGTPGRADSPTLPAPGHFGVDGSDRSLAGGGWLDSPSESGGPSTPGRSPSSSDDSILSDLDRFPMPPTSVPVPPGGSLPAPANPPSSPLSEGSEGSGRDSSGDDSILSDLDRFPMPPTSVPAPPGGSLPPPPHSPVSPISDGSDDSSLSGLDHFPLPPASMPPLPPGGVAPAPANPPLSPISEGSETSEHGSDSSGGSSSSGHSIVLGTETVGGSGTQGNLAAQHGEEKKTFLGKGIDLRGKPRPQRWPNWPNMPMPFTPAEAPTEDWLPDAEAAGETPPDTEGDPKDATDGPKESTGDPEDGSTSDAPTDPKDDAPADDPQTSPDGDPAGQEPVDTEPTPGLPVVPPVPAVPQLPPVPPVQGGLPEQGGAGVDVPFTLGGTGQS